MKIKITIAGMDNIAVILPLSCAGIAAELLAKADVYERDGYYSTSGWKRAENGVVITYIDGTELEPTHPKTAEAQADAAKKRAEWYREYQARQTAEKERDELKAALAALQATVVCHTAEPAEEAKEVIEDEDE